jgi:cytochrome c oxidase cbb3-type subunit I/II
MQKQADVITKRLKESGVTTTSDKEIVALIAYLQRLGTDIKLQAGDGALDKAGVMPDPAKAIY